MTSRSKDLFDDSTMSFGEHLEVLRIHLLRGIIGLAICVLISLYFGNRVIDIVRGPIDTALAEYGIEDEDVVDVEQVDWWQKLKDSFMGGPTKQAPVEDRPVTPNDVLRVTVSAEELAEQLFQSDPKRWPKPDVANNQDPQTVPAKGSNTEPGKSIVLNLKAPEFREFRQTTDRANKPITLNVQEAFLTYLKVSFVAGFVIASPWVFYQAWLFVAAGLYPHERKYVYIYLPLSLGLFLIGAVFCFKLVFPFVLKFLLGFNALMEVQPQIRLSEWISFAIMLPMMFGLSFQLPLVMLFLERISVFDVETYQTKRRMAILVIAVVSMMMTPADPASMLLMMFPLIVLYELGIIMCSMRVKKSSPFEDDEE